MANRHMKRYSITSQTTPSLGQLFLPPDFVSSLAVRVWVREVDALQKGMEREVTALGWLVGTQERNVQ